MMLILSVLSVFVRRAWVEHESRSEAWEHADFYLQGREASTIATYNTECKKLAEYCMRFGKVLCGFGERDVVTYIVKEANKGKKKAERIGMTKKKL